MGSMKGGEAEPTRTLSRDFVFKICGDTLTECNSFHTNIKFEKEVVNII